MKTEIRVGGHEPVRSRQPAHTWGHPEQAKRRAAVGQRPVTSKSMRSGSPRDQRFEPLGFDPGPGRTITPGNRGGKVDLNRNCSGRVRGFPYSYSWILLIAPFAIREKYHMGHPKRRG